MGYLPVRDENRVVGGGIGGHASEVQRGESGVFEAIRSRASWVLAVGILTLAACDGGPSAPAPPAADGASDRDADDATVRGQDDIREQDDVAEVGAEVPDAAGTAPEDVASGANGALRLSGWVEHNPRMISVALRSVEVDDHGHLRLDIEAVNRGFRGRSASSLALSDVRVTDDLGNQYAFQRPEEHRDLRFEADERLTGTLAFEGPVDPDARHLEVAFNQRDGESVPTSEDQPSQYPKFLFADVPLPGIGLEDAADRGGSSSLLEVSTVELDLPAQIDWLPDLDVTLLRYHHDGQTTEFDLEAANQTDLPVELASGHPRLDDGTDGQIVYEPNDSDDRDERVIRLEPGDEATFTIAFRGAISPQSEGLRLRLNPNNHRSESPTRPFVRFEDLPLPEEGSAS